MFSNYEPSAADNSSSVGKVCSAAISSTGASDSSDAWSDGSHTSSTQTLSSLSSISWKPLNMH